MHDTLQVVEVPHTGEYMAAQIPTSRYKRFTLLRSDGYSKSDSLLLKGGSYSTVSYSKRQGVVPLEETLTQIRAT